MFQLVIMSVAIYIKSPLDLGSISSCIISLLLVNLREKLKVKPKKRCRAEGAEVRGVPSEREGQGGRKPGESEAVRAGASGKDLDGVEGVFSGGSAAQGKGKPERFKYPRRTKYLPLCYLAFWLCSLILGWKCLWIVPWKLLWILFLSQYVSDK